MPISKRNKFASELFDAIERFDTIVLFRHMHPDMDAQGSQRGLKAWLQAAFPQKTILAAGSEGGWCDAIDPTVLENALAIITDTATSERVDDSRYRLARESIRIDHHVPVETFTDLDYVDDQAAAACEIIALLLKERGVSIPADAAQWLLKGLMTDTQRFCISSVRPETFEAAAWLVGQGANPVQARRDLFTVGQTDWQYGNRVRLKAQRRGRLLFAVMSRDDYLSLGLDNSAAREHVNDLADVEDTAIWALFTQNGEDDRYGASLRSNSVVIRDLAADLGGGGHDFASGIKNITVEQLVRLIGDLEARAAAH